ncbi:Pol protein [Phytophthora palmivora]|uniref:Pol protein n=1 Tax=Phytophthora palmivora TaxID=4796 RepID=A0A2P4XUY1_9STRA|nr:Pol protein [Phytophthora palmivora]
MVLRKPETSPEDVSSSSITDWAIVQGFAKQRYTSLGSRIFEVPIFFRERILGCDGKTFTIPAPVGSGGQPTNYCTTRQWFLPTNNAR